MSKTKQPSPLSQEEKEELKQIRKQVRELEQQLLRAEKQLNKAIDYLDQAEEKKEQAENKFYSVLETRDDMLDKLADWLEMHMPLADETTANTTDD